MSTNEIINYLTDEVQVQPGELYAVGNIMTALEFDDRIDYSPISMYDVCEGDDDGEGSTLQARATWEDGTELYLDFEYSDGCWELAEVDCYD